MRRYIAIASLALAAGMACSKIDSADNLAPQKIGFEAACYVSVITKGIDDFNNKTFPVSEGGSLFAEGLSPVAFRSYGFFYPTDGPAGQIFMNGVTISPNGASSAETTQWTPAQDYYWPRSGYINFVSYASKHPITASANAVGTKEVGLEISAREIVADDNILIADAVFNANQTNCSGSTLTVTGEETSGVPTLFRHALARISFNFQLYATSATTDTDYTVTITSASLTCNRTGAFSSTNDGSGLGEGLAIQKWFATAATTGWTASNPGSIPLGTPELTLGKTTKESSVAKLLDERSVVPQNITSDIKISLNYTVEAKHGSTVYSREKVATGDIALNASGLPETWGINQKIIYLIKLNPVTNKVSFDPAVQDWVTENAGSPIDITI